MADGGLGDDRAGRAGGQVGLQAAVGFSEGLLILALVYRDVGIVRRLVDRELGELADDVSAIGEELEEGVVRHPVLIGGPVVLIFLIQIEQFGRAFEPDLEPGLGKEVWHTRGDKDDGNVGWVGWEVK